MLPEGFVKKYQQLLGAEAPAFFESFQQPRHKGFRINPLKPNPTEVALDLSKPVPYAKWGYYGAVNGRQVDHQAGYVYSQEPSAMYVAAIAAPQPGERVLDLCAAPGGKTTYLASFMQQQGLLVSNEIMPKRARILAENVERFGIQNAVILNESPAHLAPRFPAFFDTVLVDAPCSGEGMFRKDPAAQAYWTPDYPAKCATRQREIMTEALKMVRPGGHLVYSTCTFSPEEDEQMMAWVLANYPEFRLQPIKRYPGMTAGRPDWADGNPELAQAVRLFPHHIDGEGHFMALLQRAATTEVPVTKPKKKVKKGKQPRRKTLPDQDQVALWQAFEKNNLNCTLNGDLVVFGDQLYLSPETLDLTQLKVVRPGLHLGTLKRQRFEPSYALALALKATAARHHLALSAADYRAYVHGDTFKTVETGKHWVLLTYQAKTVGFGKLVNGTVKNFFPKGLRFEAAE